MDSAQMIAFMRKIEQAVPPELNQLVILPKREPKRLPQQTQR